MRCHPWLLVLCCCSALPAQAGRTTNPEPELEFKRNIVYTKRGSQELKLDLYRPAGKKPVPFGLVIHGGGWYRGGKLHPDAVMFCRMLNRAGIAAASISYRLAPRDVHPAQIEDCRSALQYLREHADELGLDRNRVVAVGASAGGHLAALLGTQDDRADPKSPDPVARQSTRPQCVVSFCGPMNLDPAYQTTARGKRLVKSFLGVRTETRPEDIRQAADASPRRHLTADDCPMLLVHGTADRTVPPVQSEHMAKALEEAGVPHELVFIDGAGHRSVVYSGVGLADHGSEIPHAWQRALGFVRTHLRTHRER